MINSEVEFNELKVEVSKETGFVCYDPVGSQQTWFGPSANIDAFKKKVLGKVPTGTVLYLVDTKKSYMYLETDNSWY